jgi:hypothetical protein
MTMNRLPVARIDLLRQALPDSVGLLVRRRAADIPSGYIEDYVALNWLEWHGGTLRLTTTGENVSRQNIQRPGAPVVVG